MFNLRFQLKHYAPGNQISHSIQGQLSQVSNNERSASELHIAIARLHEITNSPQHCATALQCT